eukprot:scaffold531324_cov39-Prasinocladus_malaysianus.AAC.1
MDADQMQRDPQDLRTRPALEKSMHHLLWVLDHPDYSFARMHKFLWDRYRGVRQCLSCQVFAEL